MKQLLKENKYFLIPYLVTLIIGGILLIIYTKPELHILSNKYNSVFFDFFFKYTTSLGNGVMIAILFIILLFAKFRYAFAFLIIGLLTSAVVNILKKLVLDNIYRPSKYFELYETYQLHFVDGVKLHSLQSFPSGHTGTSFNVFLTLAIITKNKFLKLTYFILAALVAYSRVYLSQHFMIDIVVGSIIAVILTLFIFNWFNNIDKMWLDKSIIRRK